MQVHPGGSLIRGGGKRLVACRVHACGLRIIAYDGKNKPQKHETFKNRTTLSGNRDETRTETPLYTKQYIQNKISAEEEERHRLGM